MLFRSLILLPFLLFVVPDNTKENDSHDDVYGYHDDFDKDVDLLNSFLLCRLVLEYIKVVDCIYCHDNRLTYYKYY